MTQKKKNSPIGVNKPNDQDEKSTKWEDLLANVNIGGHTRQLLVVQGRLQDIETVVSNIISDYWGDGPADELLNKFYEAHAGLSESLHSLTSDIMYTQIMCVASEDHI